MKPGLPESCRSRDRVLPPPRPLCAAVAYSRSTRFNGQMLQDITDTSARPSLLCFSSFADGNRGLLVFSWLIDKADHCERFAESLRRVPDGALSGALLRFLF